MSCVGCVDCSSPLLALMWFYDESKLLSFVYMYKECVCAANIRYRGLCQAYETPFASVPFSCITRNKIKILLLLLLLSRYHAVHVSASLKRARVLLTLKELDVVLRPLDRPLEALD